MKETYSLEEVKQLLRDSVSIAFDPNPDADFYLKVFSKYEPEMQEYITNLLLAAALARKFAEIASKED